MQFKSFKGGEYRATAPDGTLYRVRKLDADAFSAERKSEWGWEAIGSGGTREAAQMVVDQIATAPVTAMVEEATGTPVAAIDAMLDGIEERAQKVEKAPAKPKGVKAITAEGKKVWRGSGPAYNAYRRMRQVRINVAAARKAGNVQKAEELEAKLPELRAAWEQAKADEKASA